MAAMFYEGPWATAAFACILIVIAAVRPWKWQRPRVQVDPGLALVLSALLVAAAAAVWSFSS